MNHDACATETMGPIYDRGREHLGASDKAVIAVRKFLLKAIKSVREGKDPPHIVRDHNGNGLPPIDSIAEVISAGIHWRQYFKHLTEGAAV